MTETEFQIVKSAGFLMGLGLAVVLQAWIPHTKQLGGFRNNAFLWILNTALLGIVCGACACTVARWANAEGVGLMHWADLGLAPTLAISLLGMDALSYAWHRANHRIPFLWRFHQVHHSDAEFRATTALRFHPGELALALPIRLAGVAMLGVPVEGVILFEVLFAFANFFEHGNIELPLAFERGMARVLITPALHRRHHSQESVQLNSNYGTIFSLWDRLFGSFGASDSQQSFSIGLPGLPSNENLGQLLSMPVRGIYRGR